MNVVVIITDSLRADHCGAYDGIGGINLACPVKTPSFDMLAKEGTIFAHSYAESLPTLPARTTWWTGRVQFPFRGWQYFEHSDYLLAEVLWDKGYTSALITDTYHLHKPIYNAGRGFDTTIFIRGQEYDPWVREEIPVDIRTWHRLRGDGSDELWRPRFEQYMRNRSSFRKEEDWFTPRVILEAIRWLEHQVRGKGIKDRLFLWVDCFDPHEPWDPPEPFWSMYKDPGYSGQEIIDPVPGPVEGYLSQEELARIRSLYAGEVTFVDKWVGILLESIRDLGLYDNTMIIWTSDHGEPFGEHGIVRKARPWNYEELVRTPLIIRCPDFGHGRVVDSIVQATDLMPTILDALGIRTPLPLIFRAPRSTGSFPQDIPIAQREIELHGISLLPLIRGDVEKIRDFACTGHYGQQWSIQDHEWRYILPLEKGESPQLYHRPTDPYDQRNVIEENKDVGDHMELLLRRFVSGLS